MEVNYQGGNIYVEVTGTGVPVVLLHGFLEDSSIWETLINDLPSYQWINIDLPGHGKSDLLPGRHRMCSMAKAVDAVLETFNINKTSFLGHSMGGYVALAYAELFPEKVNRLVLLNSTSAADTESRKKDRDRAKRLVQQNKEAFVSMALKNLFTKTTKTLFPESIELLVSRAQLLPVANILAYLEGLKNRKDRTAVLKKFSGDKVIFAGEKDPIVPWEDVRKLAQETQSTFITLPNGHMGYLEDVKRFLKEIDKVL